MTIRELVLVVLAGAPALVGCTGSRPSKNETAKSEQTTSTLIREEEALLDTVQRQTFDYFWSGAEPVSGMARERIHIDGVYPENDQDVVTLGGSGFGVMAILVGAERGFITREQARERLQHIVDYLAKADRFHGAWPHWLDGPTGKVKSFGQKDDGGDLVETAFMIQGLLTAAEYFRDGNEPEKKLVTDIERLWREVEWNWYTQGGQDVLFWHWSPNYGWAVGHRIMGYDECLITYILATSSPTHPIEPEAYHRGWARDGAIANDTVVFGLRTVLRHNERGNIPVGPLFWAHYSYMGLDPRGLTDTYADYWLLNRNHALIYYKYALDNPKGFAGYGPQQWGMTASYSVNGYAAHSPQRDFGVITPTAALSSFPYTPEESMQVLKYLYNEADSLIGKFGPYDAYSISNRWFVRRYLAIDQGPIPVMIENYRSAFPWRLFMRNKDVQTGLKKLGFKSDIAGWQRKNEKYD